MSVIPKRKVYVLSDLDKSTINSQFNFLDEDYERTHSLDEADFIIVDLDNQNSIPELERTLFVIEPNFVQCKPLILSSFREGGPAKLDNIANMYRCTPPVCRTRATLKESLSWYSFMFPRSHRIIDKAISQMALQKMRRNTMREEQNNDYYK